MIDRALQISILQTVSENTKDKNFIKIVNSDLNLKLSESEIIFLTKKTLNEDSIKSILFLNILYFIANLKPINLNNFYENFEIISDIITEKLNEIGISELKNILFSSFEKVVEPTPDINKENKKEVKKEEDLEEIFL